MAARPQSPCHVQAIHTGKHDIEQDQVKCMGLRLLKPFDAIHCYHHRVAFPQKAPAEQFGHFGIVFHDEYPHLQYYQLVTAGLGLDEDFAYRRPAATQLTLRIDPYNNEDSYERSLDHSSKRRVCREKTQGG
jgi:hypothetical protein